MASTTDESSMRQQLLIAEYESGRQSNALALQTSTIHVATGFVLFATQTTLLIAIHSDDGGTRLGEGKSWALMLLPAFVIFHLGWTTYRYTVQVAEEQYQSKIEHLLRDELSEAHKANGLEVPAYTQIMGALSTGKPPARTGMVAVGGAAVYVVGQIAVVVSTTYAAWEPTTAFWYEVLILLFLLAYAAAIVICTWVMVRTAFGRDTFWKALSESVIEQQRAYNKEQDDAARIEDLSDQLDELRGRVDTVEATTKQAKPG